MSLPQSNRRLGAFVQKNQSRWMRLEELIHQYRRRSLSKQELDELGFLYRQVAGHLAYAQTYFPQHDVTRRLNELTMKAHNLIYGAVKKRRLPKLFRFFTHNFPLLFYERIPFSYRFLAVCGRSPSRLFSHLGRSPARIPVSSPRNGGKHRSHGGTVGGMESFRRF